MKALIIDDEKDICILLRRILSQENLETSCAGTITEAKEMIKTDPPSIIFLDNHLPDGLGVSFIDQIKSNCPQAKIIMITAQDAFTYKKQAVEKGVDIFLEKPFTKHEITTAVSQVRSHEHTHFEDSFPQ